MIQLAEEQLQALNKMESFLQEDETVLVLSGGAGTGKSTIQNEYIQYLDSIDYPFVLCAPTHKAKLVIEEITGYEAVTVHKLLSLSPNIEIFNLDYKDLKFNSGGLSEIPSNGIIIIDEASMINDEIYKLLIEYCNRLNTKILFIGDEKQLKPVNNGGISLVFKHPNKILLTRIHRQVGTNALLPLLNGLRNTPKKIFEPINAPEGSLFVYNNAKDFIIKAVDEFKIAINKQDVVWTKLLAYTNSRVKGLNECMRRCLWSDEEEYHQFEFITGYDNFEYNRNQFYNSSDYIITSKPRKVERHIPYYLKLPGYDLELYDKVYKRLLNVFTLDRTISSDYLDALSYLIEEIRMSAIEYKYSRIKANKLWRRYFEIIKSFATPVDLMFDNRVIKKKTFDYGYALSVHKSQGSSLNTVYIDMNNILQCRSKEELRQLQYVALSRTKTDAHILL